jgi:hypothetical protein
VIATTVLTVGILAVLGTFSTGYVALSRASIVGTASALADRTMEAFRGEQYAAIATGTTTTTYSGTTSPPSPDGRTYTVTSTVTAGTATNTSGTTARPIKIVTVAVADSTGRRWVTEQSTFDSLTG